VPAVELADHLAAGHIERGEQRGGAMHQLSRERSDMKAARIWSVGRVTRWGPS
jgi:hypothetical protein